MRTAEATPAIAPTKKRTASPSSTSSYVESLPWKVIFLSAVDFLIFLSQYPLVRENYSWASIKPVQCCVAFAKRFSLQHEDYLEGLEYQLFQVEHWFSIHLRQVTKEAKNILGERCGKWGPTWVTLRLAYITKRMGWNGRNWREIYRADEYIVEAVEELERRETYLLQHPCNMSQALIERAFQYRVLIKRSEGRWGRMDDWFSRFMDTSS